MKIPDTFHISLNDEDGVKTAYVSVRPGEREEDTNPCAVVKMEIELDFSRPGELAVAALCMANAVAGDFSDIDHAITAIIAKAFVMGVNAGRQHPTLNFGSVGDGYTRGK